MKRTDRKGPGRKDPQQGQQDRKKAASAPVVRLDEYRKRMVSSDRGRYLLIARLVPGETVEYALIPIL